MKKTEAGWTRWIVPAVALLGGAGYLVANWIGGNFTLGLAMFAVMAAYASLLLLGGRSELIRLLRGQPIDERYRAFDLRATAFAGGVVLVALLGGGLYEMARGEDGQPYAILTAIGGGSYIVALLWLRIRS